MARPLFRMISGPSALVAVFGVAFLCGCTAPEPPPQAARPVIAPIAETALPPPPPVTQAPAAPAAVPPPLIAVTAGRIKAAMLIPLTGPNKSVGQAMLDAANMALFDVSADIALLPRDTGNGTDGARAAAEKAIADGADVILGPVFSASVPPAGEAAQGSQIDLIAYSTDASVAGGNVFVMGFLPAQQIARVVGFAKSRGLTKLAALVPDNAYGVAVTAEIGRIRDQLGLQPPKIMIVSRDIKGQIASLADDPPEMLLIALGGEQLIGLAPALKDYAAAHPVQLLGTGLWDDPALSQVPALAGGWYAAPPPGNFAAFEARFQQIYRYQPPRIATLAYDSVALAASVAKGSTGGSNPFTRDVLVQPNGFTGIDGGFRFLPTGLSERNLAVLAVGPGGPGIVDEPPPTFEKSGE